MLPTSLWKIKALNKEEDLIYVLSGQKSINVIMLNRDQEVKFVRHDNKCMKSYKKKIIKKIILNT